MRKLNDDVKYELIKRYIHFLGQDKLKELGSSPFLVGGPKNIITAQI